MIIGQQLPVSAAIPTTGTASAPPATPPAAPAGAPSTDDAIPGEYIVVFREGVDAAKQQEVLHTLGSTDIEHLPLVNGVLVRTNEDLPRGLNELAPALRDIVSFSQPNYRQHLRAGTAVATPLEPSAAGAAGTDPELAKQYHLENTGQTGGTAGADVKAIKAWNASRGAGVVVAVADTNIDITHPDIASNIWVNAKEIAGNGKDDDANGYVDDVNGWNFGKNSNRPQDGGDSHGTHVAGIIAAAQGNGIGGVGVAPDAKIMPLAILTSSATTANAIKAFGYAVQNGANLVSNSWGNNTYEPALAEAVKQTVAQGVSVVVAAGNENWDTGINGSYPDNYAGSLAVAASDHRDAKASYSNRGTTTIDIAAPGDQILSSVPGGKYAKMSGTSMAAPVVAGVMALVKAKFPHLTMKQVEERVLRSAQLDGSAKPWGSLVRSGGRIDAEAALAPLGAPTGVAVSAAAAGGRAVRASWGSDVTDGQSFDVEYSANPGARVAVAETFDGGTAGRAFTTSGDRQWSITNGAFGVSGLARGQQSRLELTETITEPTQISFAYDGGKGGQLSFFIDGDLQFQPTRDAVSGRKEFTATLQPGTHKFTWLGTAKGTQTSPMWVDDLRIGQVSAAEWKPVGRTQPGATSLDFELDQPLGDGAVRVRADNGRMTSNWVTNEGRGQRS